MLALGALGVVYGDIGTSPLYALKQAAEAGGELMPETVLGIVSLILWTLVVVVSIKYAGFIMRAHNRGDGGIMALTSLLERSRGARAGVLVTLGIWQLHRLAWKESLIARIEARVHAPPVPVPPPVKRPPVRPTPLPPPAPDKLPPAKPAGP